MAYNGVINIYKEAGYTSFDVVARLRGILGQKKIGHTGTLDPDAVGVLPVVVGNATKLVEYLTDKRKEYVAVFVPGTVTDTQDISGTVLSSCEPDVDEEKVKAALKSYVGDIMQIPPMYSALKVNGRKLCNLAREGIEVERKARPVTIYEIELLSYETGDDGRPEITIRVECSKGTYIRTLCHDVGQTLGCGAVMTSLKRTMSGQFDIKDSITLDELQRMKVEGNLADAIIPVDKMFEEYPALKLTGEQLRLARNGNVIRSDIQGAKRVRVYDGLSGEFFAVYEKDRADKRMIRPVTMFL